MQEPHSEASHCGAAQTGNAQMDTTDANPLGILTLGCCAAVQHRPSDFSAPRRQPVQDLSAIEADIPAQAPAAQREALIKLGFQGKAAIYLPEAARFDRIVSLPQGAQVGEIIDAAEIDIKAGAVFAHVYSGRPW